MCPSAWALKYADGKPVESRFGDQEYFTLTDGRCMYLNTDVAAKVYELSLRPGEPFEIGKYHSGKKGDKPQWDVRRVDPIPSARTQDTTGLPGTELERNLRRSLEQASNPGASVPPPAPVVATNGQPPNSTQPNGSSKPNGNGYVNGGSKLVPPAAPVPVKIPLNIAFREILAFCTQELQAAHEPWSDAAKQDLVSTLLIQASKEGWCTIWERGNHA